MAIVTFLILLASDVLAPVLFFALYSLKAYRKKRFEGGFDSKITPTEASANNNVQHVDAMDDLASAREYNIYDDCPENWSQLWDPAHQSAYWYNEVVRLNLCDTSIFTLIMLIHVMINIQFML